LFLNSDQVAAAPDCSASANVETRYLRTLLIHGARSAFGRVRDKQDPRSLWLGRMRQRRHPNIVAVALANKNARIARSLVTSDSVYDVRLSVRAA
jgi:transposase